MMSAALKPVRVQWSAVFFLLGYMAICCWQLGDYINRTSTDFQLGMLTLLIVASSARGNKKGGWRFAAAAAGMAVGTVFLPVKTMLYATVLLAVFFVAETYVGKMSVLSLLVIILVSPLCRYLMSVFSFPIRLSLTNQVSALLSFTGANAVAEGNIIIYNGNEFSVDPACMGLYMLITSLLSGVMIVALQQKKYARTLRAGWLVAYLICIVVCNIVCNLCRIFILVYYKILPGTIMHDVAGLLCFMLYVIVPVLVLSGWMIKRFGEEANTKQEKCGENKYSAGLWMHAVVAAFCLVAAIAVSDRSQNKAAGLVFKNTAGYTLSTLRNNITKMENSHSLIYIKPIAGFYSSDHHPMICWSGSGYAFTKVHTAYIAGRKVYAGVLTKGDEKLYTAWWYDNGDKYTIEQWNWRWEMLKGSKPYALVNITAANDGELTQQVQYFIETGSIKNL
ncbi:MAG: exosortase N [Chitinophagaceae bacterium]|nr:exosortase N [Chitinophagaceae bacterium]